MIDEPQVRSAGSSALPRTLKPTATQTGGTSSDAESLRRVLLADGFEELRSGKGSQRQFWNPERKRVVTIGIHTKKDVGTGLLNRILKDAGIKEWKH